VTLRGPVETEAEKSAIEEKIKNIEGVQKIDNQLDVEESEVKN
jgi:osmotically-inducible protein OsmY